MQAQFAGARSKQVTLGTDDVADVKKAEQLVVALADRILPHIALQPCTVLLDVHESGFAHAADGLDASGEPDPNLGDQLVRGFFAMLAENVRDRAGKVETLAKWPEPKGFDFLHA